jgi:hypothetical protein
MMRKKVELGAVCLALSIVGCSTRQLIGVSASTEWTPSAYPNPTVDTKACGRRGVRSWVCDPDGLLSYSSANVVEGTLKEIAAAEDPFVSAGCKQRGPGDPKGYQVRGPALLLSQPLAWEFGLISCIAIPLIAFLLKLDADCKC